MPFWLCPESLEEAFFKVLIASSPSEEFPQVNLLVREQAGPDLSIRCQSKSVAFSTEMVAHRADQPDLAGASLKSESQGRAIPLIHRQCDQVSDLFKPGPYFWDGQDVGFAPGVTISCGHVFDVPNDQRKVEGEPRKILNLIVVQSFDGYHVDLDGREADIQRLENSFPDFFVLVLSSDLAEPISPERIEADVHPFQTGASQIPGKLFEEDSVGGETEIVDARDLGEKRNELNNPFPDERFSPGESHLRNPFDCEDTHNPEDFFVGKDVFMGDERNSLLRHTVAAPEVAPIRYRNPQVIDSSFVWIK